MVVIVAELSEMSPGTEAWAPLPLRVGRRLLHGQPGWGWNCSWAQAGASLSGLSESAYPRKRGVDEWVTQAIARCWDLQSWKIPHILLPTEGSDFNPFPRFTITPKELDQIHRWHKNYLSGRNGLDKVIDFCQGPITFQIANMAVPTIFHSIGLESNSF